MNDFARAESWLMFGEVVDRVDEPVLGEHPGRRRRIERVADERQAHRDHEHVADEVVGLVAEQVEPDQEPERDRELGVEIELVGEVDDPAASAGRTTAPGARTGCPSTARSGSPDGRSPSPPISHRRRCPGRLCRRGRRRPGSAPGGRGHPSLWAASNLSRRSRASGNCNPPVNGHRGDSSHSARNSRTRSMTVGSSIQGQWPAPARISTRALPRAAAVSSANRGGR